MKKINVDKMTVKELYAAHQELWFWLADNPSESKYRWPGWEKYSAGPMIGCFPCSYADRFGDIFECRYNCNYSKCFLDWVPCDEPSSLYGGWRDTYQSDSFTKETLRHRAVIADLIATVPLKEKYQKEDK